MSFLHLLVGLVLGCVLVVKTRAFDSAYSWRHPSDDSSRGGGGGGNDSSSSGSSSASSLASFANRVTSRLEAAAQLLCGGSWLQSNGAEQEAQPASGVLSRLLAWWLLLCYLHCLAIAIS